ncbi:ABC transporter substrate-binding protein [Aureimonas jatrophae]|jgi:polar amino acid transport system substrate-binding protein|uniref:Amino acid ABC transporter substrate-binding protein, PAAT family n=1 Tax=Aureimonas jatrophae TaxID=1166073 RepID=A0A1H0GE61_9HYPH|nr:ABC transporter substrate-binding protein [Aureimonas jatrophae]MBB3949530.1 polar amino acid transport system substrate-binding protein [Aureimonas jatrophae]SDO05197.1 amino acid ABC transporter substrate-binding protein, PAAT family [Aureimonas jatrophae]
MRTFKTLLLTAAALSALAGVAAAQSGDADKTWTEVRIGSEGAYPPFNFLDASGKLQGFDIDIANALCQQMKVTCTFVTNDWDGMIPALQNDRFDAVIASMSITPEREKQVLFTNKYYNTPGALAVPKDSAIADTTAASLSGKTIGVQGSTTHSQAVETYFPDADVRVYPTAEEYKLDIENGRLDAVSDDIVVLSQWIDSPEGACCKVLGSLPPSEQIYGRGAGIALRKGDEKLKKMFDDAIVAIRADGTYKTIQDKYFKFDVYGQ